MTGSNTSTIFERGVFFTARAVVGLVALIGAIGIVASVFAYMHSGSGNARVSYAEVKAELAKSAPAQTSGGAKESGAPPFPSRVSFYLGDGENKKVLLGWLDALPTPAAKAEFLDNMESVITEAEAHGDNVPDAVNAYRTIKFTPTNESPYAGYEHIAEKALAVGALLFSLAILLAAAMLLVVLAIERNTRPGRVGAPGV